MLHRAQHAVLNGTIWYTTKEIKNIFSKNNKHVELEELITQLIENKKIFFITYNEIILFPHYIFDEQFNINPTIEHVLRILDDKNTWQIACWFESINSYLHNQNPRTLLNSYPELIIEAAFIEKQGCVHG